MSSLFKNYSKNMNNEFAGVVADKGTISDVSSFIDTGSYILNALISGDIFKGIPQNKIIALSSESGVGKSYIAVSICKTFQEKFPNGFVLYYESEGAFTSEMFAERGVDTSRLLFAPISSVEQFKHETNKFLTSYNELPDDSPDKVPFIMVLDSVGNLSSKKEIEDAVSGKDTVDMTKAKILKATFRSISLQLTKANAPLIATAHTYKEMNSMYPKDIMGGGNSLRYVASTVLMLTKRKEKDGGEQIGNIITARVDKSRFTIENKKIELFLHFKKGLHKYHGLVDMAIAAGIFKKSGTRVELPSGEKLFEKKIMKNPDEYFTPEILDQINEYAKNFFSYGGTLEETLEEISEEKETDEY